MFHDEEDLFNSVCFCVFIWLLSPCYSCAWCCLWWEPPLYKSIVLPNAGSVKRSGSVIRPSSPKSPVASASAFESVEGSDEDDDLPENGKLENHYGHENGNVVTFLNMCWMVWLKICFLRMLFLLIWNWHPGCSFVFVSR